MTTVPRLSLLLLTAALALPAAAAADKTVNPGDDANAIVDSAAAGETITFKAGTHNGPVSVEDDDITLKGEPGAVIIVTSGTAATVSFAADGGKVHDLVIASTVGDAVTFDGGTAQVLRSTIASTKSGGRALLITSGTGDPARTLTVDSTVLKAPISLMANYANPTIAGAGITVAARHVTAVGNVLADSTGTPALAAQPIGITFTDSIVLGALGAVGGDTAPAATITAATDRNHVAATDAEKNTLFVRPDNFNFHLRADAPVIGKGQVTSGESATDVDGDERGTTTDYGADEFVNKAPSVTLAGPTGVVRQGIAATFTATGTDPEANSGGGVASYVWTFGDGSTETTTTPTVSHAFPERKDYTVSVTVTDKQGATSAPATAGVTVLDGTAPTATIQQPGTKQRITLYKKAKKGKRAKRARVLFFGTAADDTALGSVVLALRKVAVKDGTCSWFNGKKGFVKADCTTPALLKPTLVDGQWRYRLPTRARLPKGPYQLFVVPIDASGLAGTSQTVAFRFR
jgi:PKD repeat protein